MSEGAVKPERGDIVLLEYTVIDKASSKVLETTSEEVAKQSGIFNERAKYGPRLIVVGAGELPAGVEELITEMHEGENREVVLPPEKTFGKRDPARVRVMPARELSARGIVPRVGMEIEVRGEKGTIISIGGGRVIVDFNHPLAGRELTFKVKVAKVLKSSEEKVKALFEKHVTVNGASVSYEDGTVTVTIPFASLFSPENLEALNVFRGEVERYITEVRTVRLVSTLFERKAKEIITEGSGAL